MVDMRWHQIRQKIAQIIEKSGQFIQIVHLSEGDLPDAQPFMYTIGNFQLGLSELLIVGTDEKFATDILNMLGELQRKRGKAFVEEELVDLGGKFPVRIVDAGEIGRRDYATFVGMFYDREDYKVRQVLLPDTQGRWPDTPGCDRPYCEQPILSSFGRAIH